MIQTSRMVSSGVMQLHRGYEEVITPAGVQPPTRQYRCSIDLYAGRIPAPQQVLMLVDTAQVEATSRAKTYTYLLLLSSNDSTKKLPPVYVSEELEHEEGSRKIYVQFESQQDEEERKTREKVRMNLTLLRTPVLADRRSTIHPSRRQQPWQPHYPPVQLEPSMKPYYWTTLDNKLTTLAEEAALLLHVAEYSCYWLTPGAIFKHQLFTLLCLPGFPMKTQQAILSCFCRVMLFY